MDMGKEVFDRKSEFCKYIKIKIPERLVKR